MTEKTDREELVVRRAPKFGPFMIVAGLVAAIATLVVTSLFPIDPKVGLGAMFGYFSLFTIPSGAVVGALIALVLDRVGRKRARTVTAERETVQLS